MGSNGTSPFIPSCSDCCHMVRVCYLAVNCNILHWDFAAFPGEPKWQKLSALRLRDVLRGMVYCGVRCTPACRTSKTAIHSRLFEHHWSYCHIALLHYIGAVGRWKWKRFWLVRGLLSNPSLSPSFPNFQAFSTLPRTEDSWHDFESKPARTSPTVIFFTHGSHNIFQRGLLRWER